MKSKYIASVASVVVLMFATGVMAQTAVSSLIKRASPEDTILQKLKQARPDINFGKPKLSAFAGLYQVQIPGGPMIYITPDGEKFIVGETFSVTDVGFAKYEDPELIAERKKTVASIDPKQTIVFKPKGKTKAVVYVFTDIDCGYCRKLHAEMNTYTENGVQKPGYNELGIEIRYLAFPRSGIPSPSADKFISVWCSKDKHEALTKAKNNLVIPNATCDNPIAAQFNLGQQIGVDATPALLFPDGSLEMGYLPPESLAKKLGI